MASRSYDLATPSSRTRYCDQHRGRPGGSTVANTADYGLLEAVGCSDIVRRGRRASVSGGVSSIPSFRIISPKKIAAGANPSINPSVTTHIVTPFRSAGAA
jgi:hypothetical protein